MGDEVEREIERGYADNYAQGEPSRDSEHAFAPGRDVYGDELSLGEPVRLLGSDRERGHGAAHLDPRSLQRLSSFEHECPGELLLPCGYTLRNFPQYAAPLVARALPPFHERFLGKANGSHSRLTVGDTYYSHDLSVVGASYLPLLPAGQPLAVYEVSEFFRHGAAPILCWVLSIIIRLI